MVNAGEIAQQCADKNTIADKVREARIMAVERAIKGWILHRESVVDSDFDL